MQIINPKFKTNKSRYILQSLISAMTMFVITFFALTFTNIIIAGSIVSSIFIAFTVPHKNASAPRFLLGGYIVSAVCGICMHYFNEFAVSKNWQFLHHDPYIIVCTLTVGFVVLAMSVTHTEHPPAASFAMGLVTISGEKIFITVLVTIFSIVFILILKKILKNWLIDLL